MLLPWSFFYQVVKFIYLSWNINSSYGLRCWIDTTKDLVHFFSNFSALWGQSQTGLLHKNHDFSTSREQPTPYILFQATPDSLLNNWQVSKSPNRIKPTKQVYKSCEKNYKAGDFLNTLVGWVTTQQYQKSIEINTKDGKVPCRCKTHHWLWEWIRSRGWKNREQAVNNKTQENSVGAAQVGGSCELDYGIVEIKQLSGVLVGWRKCLNQM